MISIQNLSFAYKKGENIFKDLNLDLSKGNIYGLFGLNGVGKTTLLKHISGMLFPKSGKCQVNGVESKTRSISFLQNLFFVPEQFNLPKLSGEKFIEVTAPFYPTFDYEILEKCISEFEIDRSKILGSLSFGQQKKFFIAFAIATQTKLLILDEPTNGLDVPSKSQFRRILSSLENSERCIIISTHQMRDLGAIVDHVLVLNNGEIIFKQSIGEISNTLSFQNLAEENSKEIVYGEEVFGGVHAITANKTGDSTKVDLELLFNGIIKHPQEINNQFK